MIEYSIEELKYFYYNYDDNEDQNNNTEYIKRNEMDKMNEMDEMNKINHLEEALSNIIDYEYTNNHIYHIFPVIACTFITGIIISSFIVIG